MSGSYIIENRENWLESTVSYIIENRENWLESAVSYEEQYKKALLELGVGSNFIEEDIEQYKTFWNAIIRKHKTLDSLSDLFLGSFICAIGSPSFSWYNILPRFKDYASFMSTFRKLFYKKKYKVFDTVYRTVKIPIFKLHSPPIKGSKVIFKETFSKTNNYSWRIKIYGTGMGANQTIKVKYSSSFESSAGGCKQIFVPVEMKVSLIGVYKGNKQIGEGYRLEPVHHKKEKEFQKGIRSLSNVECAQKLDSSSVKHECFPLSDDHSGSIAKYERNYVYDNSFDVSVGLEVFDTKFNTKVNINNIQELKLEYHLPTGKDYDLYQFLNNYGLQWKVD